MAKAAERTSSTARKSHASLGSSSRARGTISSGGSFNAETQDVRAQRGDQAEAAPRQNVLLMMTPALRAVIAASAADIKAALLPDRSNGNKLFDAAMDRLIADHHAEATVGELQYALGWALRAAGVKRGRKA